MFSNPPPAPRFSVLRLAAAAVSVPVGKLPPAVALNTLVVPAPMSTLPVSVPVLVMTSLPAPSVMLPVKLPLLATVVLPDEVRLPTIAPVLLTLNTPAELMLPVMPPAVALKLLRVLTCVPVVAPNTMSPVMIPVAVEAFDTVLPPPTEIAVAAVMPPSLFTALPVPVDSVPLTVAVGMTLIVRALTAVPL